MFLKILFPHVICEWNNINPDSLKPELNVHFFLHYPCYFTIENDLISDLKETDENILNLYDNVFVQELLYGDVKYSLIDNQGFPCWGKAIQRFSHPPPGQSPK